MPDRRELGGLISAWLGEHREHLANIANRMGLPPFVEVQAAEVERAEPGGVSYFPKTRSRIPFNLFAAFEYKGSHPSPAASLDHAYGDALSVWLRPADAAFDGQRLLWIDSVLLDKVLREYLGRLPRLDRPAEALALELGTGLLDLIETPHLSVCTLLPVGGVEFQGDVKTGTIEVRRLSMAELSDLCELPDWWSVRRSRMPSPPESFPHERWAIVVRQPGAKDREPALSYELHRFVLALQLVGADLVGNGVAQVWTEPGPSLYGSEQRVVLPSWPYTSTPTHVSLEDVQRASRLAARIPEDTFTEPASRGALALSRFQRALLARFRPDALVDFSIALEAILVPDADTAELKHRLTQRGAWYLGRSQQERREIAQELREIYDRRSAIVHGSIRKEKKKPTQDAPRVARELVSRILCKGLEENWPTADQLNDLVLGPTDGGNPE